MAKKLKNKKEGTWSAYRVLSISAFFISVISLIALIYQSYLAREEHKLMQKQQSATVMAYLSQWFDNSPGKHDMVIGNDGIGPALIKKITISTEEGRNFHKTDDFFDHLSKSQTFLDTTNYLYSTIAECILIPANTTVEFASFDTSEDLKDFWIFCTKYNLILPSNMKMYMGIASL